MSLYFLHLYRRVWLSVAGEDPDRLAQAGNFKNVLCIHIFDVYEAYCFSIFCAGDYVVLLKQRKELLRERCFE